MSKAPFLVLGVGAGIAAYKAIQVLRLATQAGWQVQVVPTPTALQMVGKKTWEALSQRPVLVDTFADDIGGVTHIELARQANAILIVPATADLLARMANGLANDLLTNVLLASTAPVWVAPAMHTQMWKHPATVANIEVLQNRGTFVLGPVSGNLSSGDHGLGRLMDPEQIWTEFSTQYQALDGVPGGETPAGATSEYARHAGYGESAKNAGSADFSKCFASPWKNVKVVVSAGGTQEPLDPVRFLGNRSSGIFGCEIAKSLVEQGAEVTLLAANLQLPTDFTLPQMKIVQTPTAQDMLQAGEECFAKAQVLIMSAAVADFAPDQFSVNKIKKQANQDQFVLTLKKNPDILATLGAKKRPDQLVVGFAAETGKLSQVLDYGKQKATRKNADFIMINQVGLNQGFGLVDTTIHAVNQDGVELACWRGSKTEIAAQMVQFLGAQLPVTQANPT